MQSSDDNGRVVDADEYGLRRCGEGVEGVQ
jgi:hypothetical protein